MTITLKNVPLELHAALQNLARQNKRSLNQEALLCIEQAVGRVRPDPQRVLEEIRKNRGRSKAPQVDTEWIRNAIEEGRE